MTNKASRLNKCRNARPDPEVREVRDPEVRNSLEWSQRIS